MPDTASTTPIADQRARDERIIRAALSWIDVYDGVDALAALDEGDPTEAYDYIIARAGEVDA